MRSVARWPIEVAKGRLKGSAANKANGHRRRAAYHEEGRARAREREDSYVSGCMLYWAEGEKGRHSVAMSNSDPELLAHFAKFLRKHFFVPDERFRVHCNLFADHVPRRREVEQFWLTTLGLPRTCLRKSVVNTYSKYSAKKGVNKLP